LDTWYNGTSKPKQTQLWHGHLGRVVTGAKPVTRLMLPLALQHQIRSYRAHKNDPFAQIKPNFKPAACSPAKLRFLYLVIPKANAPVRGREKARSVRRMAKINRLQNKDFLRTSALFGVAQSG
jgi:hypothetical protein